MSSTTTSTTTPKAPVCLGTSHITLAPTQKSGLVAVFLGNDKDALRLSVIIEKAVYHGAIAMDQVQMKLDFINKKNKATQFAQFLLPNNKKDNNNAAIAIPSVTPTYRLIDSDDTIQLIIKYQLVVSRKTTTSSEEDDDSSEDEEVAMKKAWSGNLERATSPTALLSFCQLLGGSINRAQEQLQQSHSSLKTIETDGDSWQKTATKLEGAWQKEKSTLLGNFCKLYNKTRDELMAAREQLATMGDNDVDSKPPAAKKPRRTEPEEEEETAPLPDLSSSFDPDMVNALAAGKPVALDKKSKTKSNKENTNTQQQKAKKAAAKKTSTTTTRRPVKREHDSSDDSSDSSSNQKKKKPTARKLAYSKNKGDNDNSDDSVDSETRRVRALIFNTKPDDSSDDDRCPTQVKRQPNGGNNKNNNSAAKKSPFSDSEDETDISDDEDGQKGRL